MAAPTPVSALVHSSTLVAAGVFLLLKFFSGGLAASIKIFLVFGGLLTATVAGVSATVEIDLKKIVALSTMRQLGFMVRALGAGLPSLAFFHLCTHAIFKRVLFIQIGNFMHLSFRSQEKRGIRRKALTRLPTIINTILAVLALCGLLFSRGFIRKDLILEASRARGLTASLGVLL